MRRARSGEQEAAAVIKFFVLWWISTILVGPLIGRFVRGRTGPDLYVDDGEKVMTIDCFAEDAIVEDAQLSPLAERPGILSASMLASRRISNVAH